MAPSHPAPSGPASAPSGPASSRPLLAPPLPLLAPPLPLLAWPLAPPLPLLAWPLWWVIFISGLQDPDQETVMAGGPDGIVGMKKKCDEGINQIRVWITALPLPSSVTWEGPFLPSWFCFFLGREAQLTGCFWGSEQGQAHGRPSSDRNRCVVLKWILWV